MPLPTPNEGESQSDFVSRCMGNPKMKTEYPEQKQRSAVCYSQFKRKEDTEPIVKEHAKFKWTEEFRIDEGAVTDKDRVKITGPLMRETTSRNGRTYTLEEIQKARITGQTISVNHTESVTDNVGTLTVHPVQDGLDFTADIQNTAYHPGIVEMIRDKLVKFTSIEAIADEMVKEGDNIVAKGIDITGLGLVKTPGIPEMTIAISEAFDEAELSTKKRKSLPKSDFVFPDKAPGSGSYPIPDLAHARNALARVAQHGTPAEVAAVKKAVYKRFPELRPDKGKESGDIMTEEKENETETQETEETEKKKPEVEEKKNEKEESLIDKSIEKVTKEFESKESELKKEIDVLKESVKKLQEQPAKGKVTEESNYPPLKKSLNKDGTYDIYSESFLY